MDNPVKSKIIIHLDMDAFYPSVEVLDDPVLKGKPVIVGGSRKRGVVASASYEARKFGIHSAQPIATAMRLCPEGIFLPVRMFRYKEISKKIFEIFRAFSPLVEPLSIDEAFLDISGSARLLGSPKEIAKKIKDMVVKETGLTVSAGVAPSKFVAKIASDFEKPDGLTVVCPDYVRAFLDPLPIDKMWGVGKATKQALNRLNVQTIGDLSRVPVKVLERKFGRQGRKMHLLGIDDRDVVPFHEIKSIGHEETFSRDITDVDRARKEILSLSNRVSHRMRQERTTARTITLKVKYSDFVQVTRSTTLSEAIDDGLEIYSACCRLLKNTLIGKRPVRLLGVSVSHLEPSGTESQMSLFQQERESQKRSELNAALDSINEKFGHDTVRPGTLL